MSTTLFDIDQLSDAELEQARSFLRETLGNEYPSLDLKTGSVWNDLLIRIAAIFHALEQQDIEALQRSMSLAAINADPTLADPDYVNGVMSNFLIERDDGAKATGYVRVILNALQTTIINDGTTFTTGEYVFTTEATYVGVTDATAVLRSTERLIELRSDGNYEFTIPVVAAAEGTGYNIEKGTDLTMSPAPTPLVLSEAAVDFESGLAQETNAALTAKLSNGITAKVLSGRQHIAALLREQLASIASISIIGFGDPEMLRDKHNVMQLAVGGKSDIYVQTQPAPIRKTLTVTATLVDAETKEWQFGIARDDAPGFLLVSSVYESSSSGGSLELSYQARAADISQESSEFVPYIDTTTSVESAYSRYQTSVLRFLDPSTAATVVVGDTATYYCDVWYLPGVDTLQDYINQRGVHTPQADYLLRAPIPLWSTVSALVKYKNGTVQPSESAVQQAVLDQVNGVGFGSGILETSDIIAAIKDVIGEESYVSSPIEISARLYKPDGTSVLYRSNTAINIPNDFTNSISSRTAMFLIVASNISITFETVDTVEV